MNHINSSDGSFMCAPENDCESTRFDSCLVGTYCWPDCVAGAGSNAGKVAAFLKCFEGVYANSEQPTDPARRRPCMLQAGLDFDKVMDCARDGRPGGELARMQAAINATRAAMYRRIAPAPGLFPHIFVNGAHQWNNSWTALTRTVCDLYKEENRPLSASRRQLALRPGLPSSGSTPAACEERSGTFSFMIESSDAVTAGTIRRFAGEFAAAALTAVNLAASQVALPVHFHTKAGGGPPGPDDPPSYVDTKPVSSAALLAADPSAGGAIRVAVRLDGVLSWFGRDVERGGGAGEAAEYLAWALSHAERGGHPLFGTVANSSITRQRAHVPGAVY